MGASLNKNSAKCAIHLAIRDIKLKNDEVLRIKVRNWPLFVDNYKINDMQTDPISAKAWDQTYTESFKQTLKFFGYKVLEDATIQDDMTVELISKSGENNFKLVLEAVGTVSPEERKKPVAKPRKRKSA